jgi:hypothetical protein
MRACTYIHRLSRAIYAQHASGRNNHFSEKTIWDEIQRSDSACRDAWPTISCVYKSSHDVLQDHGVHSILAPQTASLLILHTWMFIYAYMHIVHEIHVLNSSSRLHTPVYATNIQTHTHTYTHIIHSLLAPQTAPPN